MTAIQHQPLRGVAAGRSVPAGPAAAARIQRFVRRPAGREFGLLGAVYVLYAVIRRITSGNVSEAVGNARRVLHAERVTGVAPEQWLNHAVSTRPFLAIPADYAYATLHYVITPAVLVWLWHAHPLTYLSARRTLMATTLIGLIGFATIPLAPPRMLPGFIDTMGRYGGDGWWGSEASAPKGLGSLTNQFAAMPSLHVGWAVWCGWMVARHAQRARIRGLAVAYPILIVLVVLSTANHYLVDALAGLVVLGAGFAVSRAVVHRGWLKPAPSMIGVR